jgi:Protein kinase domain
VYLLIRFNILFVDMWSLGCILAELYTGFAILPGEDESDQLACIIELLGMPPKQVLENSKRAKIFFNAKGYPRYCSLKTLDDGSVIMSEGFSRRGIARGPPGSRKLKNALNGCDDVYFLQFISECLEWVPEKRLTPEQAFKHSWFKRRLPKLPHASGTAASSSSNSYSGNLNPTKPQPQSLTTSSNVLTMESKETPSASSSSAIPSNKGITANCFYYDNTLHQLNVNNNQQHAPVAQNEDPHKSLPGNAASTYHHQSGSSASKLSDKYQCESYQDLSNRKSMTLNRLMSSSLHSASTLSLVSSHNSSSSNTVNNNGSSAASAGISHLTSSSKLPSLN